MDTYVWHDPSPVDGCAIVDFMMSADSVADVVEVARQVPWGRCRSAKKLREVGGLRKARPDEALPGRNEPGALYWLTDDDVWRRLEP